MGSLKRCVKKFGDDNVMKLHMLILTSFVLAKAQLPDSGIGNVETDHSFSCPPNQDIRPCYCTAMPPTPEVYCCNIRSLKTMNSALSFRFRENNPIPYLKIWNAKFMGLPSRSFVNVSMTRLQIKDSNLRYVASDAFAGLESLLILILQNVKLLTFPSESLTQLSALVKLSLPSNSLFGVGENHFTRAGGLKYLSLEENSLTHLERGSFPHTLVTLSLSRNRLTTLNKSIRNLPNLEWLFLNHNRLNNIEGEFSGLYSLTSLRLSNNFIQHLGSSIRHLHNLQILELQYNAIMELGSSLRCLSQLKKLNLSMNLLIHLNLNDFNGLVSLKLLDLSGNRLLELNGALRNLPSLVSLYLSGNALQNFSFSEICFLKQLKYLDLSKNNLLRLYEEEGGLTLPSNSLVLSDNRLISLGNFLRHFPQLREVDISHNQLRTLRTADFTVSSRLFDIVVQGNPLICDAEQMTVYHELRNLGIEVEGEPECSMEPRYV